MAIVKQETWGFKVEAGVELSPDTKQAIAEDACQRWARANDFRFVQIVRSPQLTRTSHGLVLFWDVIIVVDES